MSKNTELSLGYFRDAGFMVAGVEKWNHIVKRRIDLFGFADILAIRADPKSTVFIQTTTDRHIKAHIEKIQSPDVWPKVEIVLRAGHRVVIHGWGKHGPRGKAKRWELTKREVTLKDGR